MQDDTIKRLIEAVRSLPKHEAERLVKATIEKLEEDAEAAELADIERELVAAITTATNIENMKQMLRGMLDAGQDADQLKRELDAAFATAKPGAR